MRCDLIEQGDPAADRRRELDEALAKAQDDPARLSASPAVGSMSTSIDDWEAMRRAGEAGHAQRPADELCIDGTRAAEADRRSPTAWLYGDRLRAGRASSSSPTARSARAARG